MKKHKFVRELVVIFMVGTLLFGCSKMDSTYKKFIKDGEKDYSSNPDSISIAPGKNRLQFSWLMKSSPNITRYVIYWNGRQDSVAGSVQDVLHGDTIRISIDSLAEGQYNFEIYTFDKVGNSSIGRDTTSQVYGEEYTASLSNRQPIKQVSATGNNLLIRWYDADTTNVLTQVRYTDLNDEIETTLLSRSSTIATLEAWKPGTKIAFRSVYKPTGNALDSFVAEYYDTATINVSNSEIDKDLWEEANLPEDTKGRSGCELDWLWDGKPADYPNVYYPDASESPPIAFTVNLGRVYDQLTKIEEWGRSGGYYNPVDFEVWGIADTTGAIVDLSPRDGSWKDEMIDKGWSLLADVHRTDGAKSDGEASDGWPADFITAPPPVQFIRVRVVTTTHGGARVHLSELTIWGNILSLEIQ